MRKKNSSPREGISRVLAILLAIVIPACVVILAHQVAKFPEEPALMNPLKMYDNYAFALALGLGAPWPRLTGALLLLGIAWGGYWMGRKIGNWIG